MLRSSNPVLSRQDAFSPSQQQAGYQQFPGYPGQPQYGGPQDPRSPQQTGRRPEGVMTFDDVITKTAITLGLVVLVAAAAFFLLPVEILMPVSVVASLATIGVVILVAVRRTIPVGLVLVFAVLEGLMVGGISKIFEIYYPGIVAQAVFATFVAAGLTLAAYKFFNIRVTPKFKKVVAIATVAFVVVLLLNFVLSLFGVNMGMRAGMEGPVGLLPILVSAVAVVLAVLNLVLDFDYIEAGVAMGAPASQSWKAAFGLTVTLVWLYVEMLRIISYFRR